MALFPATLPAPLIDGYSGTQDQAFIRTDMEAGSQRQRQRFSAANTQMSISWLFTAAQMATFKTFFDTTINRGSDWFTYTLDLGAGDISYDARFTQPYQFSYVEGDNWRVSGNIEVRNA